MTSLTLSASGGFDRHEPMAAPLRRSSPPCPRWSGHHGLCMRPRGHNGSACAPTAMASPDQCGHHHRELTSQPQAPTEWPRHPDHRAHLRNFGERDQRDSRRHRASTSPADWAAGGGRVSLEGSSDMCSSRVGHWPDVDRTCRGVVPASVGETTRCRSECSRVGSHSVNADEPARDGTRIVKVPG